MPAVRKISDFCGRSTEQVRKEQVLKHLKLLCTLVLGHCFLLESFITGKASICRILFTKSTHGLYNGTKHAVH